MNFSSGITDALDPLRLRLLVEVQRRGSISAAAEACRVGEPSATKHLKTLEAALGERLVERKGRARRLPQGGGPGGADGRRGVGAVPSLGPGVGAVAGGQGGARLLG